MEKITSDEIDLKERKFQEKKELMKAINDAISLIEKIPEEKRTEREKWILKTVRNGLEKIEQDGKFLVEVKKDGKVVFSEREGIPVDDLIDYLKGICSNKVNGVWNNSDYNKQLKNLEIIFENKKKLNKEKKKAWFSVYDGLNSGLRNENIFLFDLKVSAEKRVKDWEKMDGQKYDEETIKMQLGEALNQIVLERKDIFNQMIDSQEKQEKNEAILKLINILEENSKNYTELHPEVMQDETRRDERIKLEAYFMYKDFRAKKSELADYYSAEGELGKIAKEEASKVLGKRRELVFEKKEVIDPNSDIIRREDDEIQKQAFDTYRQDQEDERVGVVVPPTFIEGDGGNKNEVFKRQTYIVAVDEIVKRMASRQADERVAELLQKPEEDMESSSRLKSILNNLIAPFRHPVQFGQKLWVRMAENGYRDKFYREALEQITQNQNLMLELEKNYRIGRMTNVVNSDANKDYHFALLDKVLAEYSNNVVELEELGNRITDPRVDIEIKKFFYSCLLASKAKKDKGGMQRDLFEKMQRGFLAKMKKQGLITNEDFLGEENVKSGMRNTKEIEGGAMYASNFFQVFQDYEAHIKNSLEQIGVDSKKRGEKLTKIQKEQLSQHIDGTLALDIKLGAKLADVFNRRPNGSLFWTDKIVNSLQNIPILRRIASNPGAFAILGSVGGNILSKGLLKWGVMGAGATTGLITGAWLPVLAGAVTAGTFGALRRNKEMKYDRAMHQRQRTEGNEYSKRFRRGEMEKFQYDVKSTTDLDAVLEGIIKATTDNGGNYNLLPFNQKEALAEIFARYKVEVMLDRNRRAGLDNATVDLISASLKGENKEKNTHYLSKTDLKIKLYRFLEQQNLIDQQKKPVERDFSLLFQQKAQDLLENIEIVDKAFDQYRSRSARTAGLIAGLSATIGLVAGQAIVDNFIFSGNRYTAFDSLKDLFQSKGNKELDSFLPAISLGGQRLKPGLQDVSFQGENFKIFIDPKTGTTIDANLSQLPNGWKLEVPPQGGLELVHETFQKIKKLVPAKDWNDFVQKNGWKNDQRVSYRDFNYQITAPEKGVRALPETVNNFINNLRLRANSTELMMYFKQDKSGNGDVLVDVSKMLKETIKSGAKDKGLVPDEVLKKGGKFFLALSESNNETQHNPILIPMDEKGIMRVPADLAKTFFAFDQQGNLIEKNPGKGMKSFIFDTGLRREKDGAMIVEGIANRLGEKPEFIVSEEEIIKKREVFPFDFDPGKKVENSWAIGPAGVSRWQLEENIKQKKEEDKKKVEDVENQIANQTFSLVPEENQNVASRKNVFAEDPDKNNGTEGRTFTDNGDLPAEEFRSAEVIIPNENENKKWLEFKKNFPDSSKIDEYLKELAILETLIPDRRKRLEKAIEFLKPFSGFLGILQPIEKRRQFNNFERFFRVKTNNNLLSERDLAKLFSRLLKEELKKNSSYK